MFRVLGIWGLVYLGFVGLGLWHRRGVGFWGHWLEVQDGPLGSKETLLYTLYG